MNDRTPLNANEAQFAFWLLQVDDRATSQETRQAVLSKLATAYMEERAMATRLASELVASRSQVKKLSTVVNSIASVLLEAGPTQGTPVKPSAPQLRVVPKPSCGVDGCECGDVLNHGINGHGVNW